MVINLHAHGLKGRSRLGAGGLEDVAAYLKNSAVDIASDKDVKARVVSEAMRSVTGIAPTVDTRDPKVTWVRTVPKHADWLEAVFLKSVASDPNAKPANMKIDVMPALKPLMLKRAFPALLLGAAALFGAGYFTGKG